MYKHIRALQLPVSFLKEDKRYIAYSPALDLSTSGKSFEEAKHNFAEIIEFFFDELTKTGTLEEVLLGLGWSKKNKEIVPPIVISQQLESFTVPVSR